MNVLWKINQAMFAKIAIRITTDEVVITDERIEHSNKHQNAYDRYKTYIPAVLSDPDFAFRDKLPNTAILIRGIEDKGTHVQLVLRLHVPEDVPGCKNSVLSFWEISEKRKENYLRNKEVIYKKPEI